MKVKMLLIQENNTDSGFFCEKINQDYIRHDIDFHVVGKIENPRDVLSSAILRYAYAYIENGRTYIEMQENTVFRHLGTRNEKVKPYSPVIEFLVKNSLDFWATINDPATIENLVKTRKPGHHVKVTDKWFLEYNKENSIALRQCDIMSYPILNYGSDYYILQDGVWKNRKGHFMSVELYSLFTKQNYYQDIITDKSNIQRMTNRLNKLKQSDRFYVDLDITKRATALRYPDIAGLLNPLLLRGFKHRDIQKVS